jgi:thiol-disulfide isomerase/thioredoxin
MHRRVILLCAVLALALAASVQAGPPVRAVPNCALTSLDAAQPWELEQLRGKVLWVDFWASWCGPCAESLPFLDELDREFRAQGLEVVGINVDEDPDAARDFLERHPVGFRQAFDASRRCPRDFDVPGMPASFLVDRQGVIRHVHLGFRGGDAERIRGLVRSLLAEDRVGAAAPESAGDGGAAR